MIEEIEYFSSLRILYPLIKSFVIPFVNITSTFLIVHLIHFQEVHVLFYLKSLFHVLVYHQNMLFLNKISNIIFTC